MKNFSKIKNHKTLNKRVYRTIKLMITGGKIKPGDRLITRVIAMQLGVSLTPVREALQKLSTENLVKNIPYQGMIVSTVSIKNFQEVLPICGALSGLSAQILAKKDNKREIKDLERIIEEMAISINENDELMYADLDSKFHNYIINASGNSQIIEIYNNLSNFINNYRLRSLNIEERFKRSLEEHRSIVEAIKSSDLTEANRLCQIHLENMLQNITKSLKVLEN